MSFYRYHLFFCVNRRDDGSSCCANHQAAELRGYAKERVKALGLKVPGGVRVNQAGCMGRCGEGPVAVVYPEGVWYSYRDRADIDQIIEQHLVGGRVVERLTI